MMKKNPLTVMTLAAMAMAALTFGHAAAGTPQDATDSPDSMYQSRNQDQRGQDQRGQDNHGHDNRGMMSSQPQNDDQALAAAYRTTLHTFATALRTQISRGRDLDPDFAQTAVAEMRRSYDEMEGCHQNYTRSMNNQEASANEPMMKQMRTDQNHVQNHLDDLEDEVEKDNVDSQAVIKHIDQILKSCKSMDDMETAAADRNRR